MLLHCMNKSLDCKTCSRDDDSHLDCGSRSKTYFKRKKQSRTCACVCLWQVASAAAREQAAASGLKGRELSKHLRKLLVAVGKDRARQCVTALPGIFTKMHSPRTSHVLHPLRRPEALHLRSKGSTALSGTFQAVGRLFSSTCTIAARDELYSSSRYTAAAELWLRHVSCLLQVRLARQLHLLESSGGACSSARGAGPRHPDGAAAAHHRGERDARTGAVSIPHHQTPL